MKLFNKIKVETCQSSPLRPDLAAFGVKDFMVRLQDVNNTSSIVQHSVYPNNG